MSKERAELVAKAFAQYPKIKVLFMTADNQMFSDDNKEWANAHAKTLDDKAIEEFSRPAGTAKLDIEVPAPVQAPDEKEAAKAARVALMPRYEELFKKKAAPQYDAAKMQELISAEESRLAAEKASASESTENNQENV